MQVQATVAEYARQQSVLIFGILAVLIILVTAKGSWKNITERFSKRWKKTRGDGRKFLLWHLLPAVLVTLFLALQTSETPTFGPLAFAFVLVLLLTFYLW